MHSHTVSYWRYRRLVRQGTKFRIFFNSIFIIFSSSNRLKALQEEIEKLKEGVARANEKASRPAPQYPQVPPTYIHSQSQQAMPNTAPPPAAAATNKNQSDQQPEFYDPFDDPYGFMRMPRRRANSFSGGRERDWGEWYWNLPQNRQEDGQDIPLGYAAADAYAENAPQRRDGRERNTRESVKERMRQRRQERKQREEGQVSQESCYQGNSVNFLNPLKLQSTPLESTSPKLIFS